MGKMKDVFLWYQQEREAKERTRFAIREQDYINSRKAQPAQATTQTPPQGK